MERLPEGTVTFLFTDIEGSTSLLIEHGDAYGELLIEHRRALRSAFAAHGGVEVDTEGDAFFVAFPSARAALTAAREAQSALGPGPIRVRIGLHTGEASVVDGTYVGLDVHRAARIAAAAHGGQVLLSATTRALVDGNGLRDLGEHRLKDLREPERLHQDGDADFPQLRTLHQTNLPIPATPFVGRERELAEVTSLLSGDGARLVTLTGPGGTGKTRLALQAVADAADRHPDGVYWVPLAALQDPALVLESAARALGAPGDLADHIADRRILLLLDNFEHLVSAANAVAQLLAACPHLCVVVTSREVLQLSGERVYAVPPLAASDARELFDLRARAARADFEASAAVDELCSRLEHLPLAVELAAARVRVLSPEQLVERIGQRLDLLQGGRDADPRQQTLRATIAWSYDLLDATEQQALGRLSVFSGGWTLEAGEHVCDVEIDTLGSLVDKSLIRERDGRYWMLETIREFAAERLRAQDDEQEIRTRHAQNLLDELELTAHHHIGAVDAAWLAMVDAEENNLRAALHRLAESDDGESLARLCAAAMWYWHLRTRHREGLGWIDEALARADVPDGVRVVLLRGQSNLRWRIGDYDGARVAAEECVEIARRLDDAAALSFALRDLGNAHINTGGVAEAAALYRESVEIAEAAGDAVGMLGGMLNLGNIAVGEMDYARAVDDLDRALELAHELADREGIAIGAHNLALAHIGLGDLEPARILLQDSLRAGLELSWPEGVVFPLEALGVLASGLGRHETAATIFGAARTLREPLGLHEEHIETRFREGAISESRAALGEEAFARAFEAGAALAEDEAVALGLAL